MQLIKKSDKAIIMIPMFCLLWGGCVFNCKNLLGKLSIDEDNDDATSEQLLCSSISQPQVGNKVSRFGLQLSYTTTQYNYCVLCRI